MSPAPARILAVLYVEDEPEAARMMTQTLAFAAQVDSVNTISKALSYLSVKVYDAVLLDLGLPDSVGMSGLEAIQKQSPDTPVIIVTKSRDDDDALASCAIEFGADWWLEKGASGTDVIRAIRLRIVKRRLMALRSTFPHEASS